MTEYTYYRERFNPSGGNPDLEETIDLPDEAIGVTIGTWRDPRHSNDSHAWVTVECLLPVGHPKLREGDDGSN